MGESNYLCQDRVSSWLYRLQSKCPLNNQEQGILKQRNHPPGGLGVNQLEWLTPAEVSGGLLGPLYIAQDSNSDTPTNKKERITLNFFAFMTYDWVCYSHSVVSGLPGDGFPGSEPIILYPR